VNPTPAQGAKKAELPEPQNPHDRAYLFRFSAPETNAEVADCPPDPWCPADMIIAACAALAILVGALFLWRLVAGVVFP